MSTLATPWQVDTAAPAAERPSLFQRLIKAREREARRRIQGFLASQPDERLMDLGYGVEEIAAIRQGRAFFPAS